MDIIAYFIYYLSFTLILVLIAFYAERKLAAFIQDRMGPTEVGKYGLLQPFADLLKLLQKEDIVPAGADKKLFLLAPIVIFPAVFAAISVIPLSPRLQGASLEIGIFVLLAIVALDVVGLLMAGWGSHNKYALYGAMRSVAQMVSYEVPLTLSVLSVVVLSQSMDLREIALSQGIYAENDSYFWGIKSLNVKEIGGFLSWNIFKVPFLWLAYIIFFIATLAESNRAPFDLPEGESELVGGFHTEYSGFRFAIFFLAEYTMMILVSLLGIILFWGAWNSPFPNIAGLRLAAWTTGEAGSLAEGFWAIFWLSSKTVLVLFLQVIIRWTYPRLRIDQLMYLAWKVLTPVALLILLLSAVWRVI